MSDNRQAAIAFMQRMLAFGEDQEHYKAAINALRRSQDHSAIQTKCNALAARLAEAEALRKDAMEAFALIESAPARGFDVYYAVGMARGFIRRHSLLNAELSKGISKDLSKDDAPDSASVDPHDFRYLCVYCCDTGCKYCHLCNLPSCKICNPATASQPAAAAK